MQQCKLHTDIVPLENAKHEGPQVGRFAVLTICAQFYTNCRVHQPMLEFPSTSLQEIVFKAVEETFSSLSNQDTPLC